MWSQVTVLDKGPWSPTGRRDLGVGTRSSQQCRLLPKSFGLCCCYDCDYDYTAAAAAADDDDDDDDDDYFYFLPAAEILSKITVVGMASSHQTCS